MSATTSMSPTSRSPTSPPPRLLRQGRPLLPVYNLGSGSGLSVRQIMDAVARVTGIEFTPEIRPRRPGDPARIVATGDLAARDLDWKMRHTVDEMVASAWAARQAAEQRQAEAPTATSTASLTQKWSRAARRRSEERFLRVSTTTVRKEREQRNTAVTFAWQL